jgi:hypothetical protein
MDYWLPWTTGFCGPLALTFSVLSSDPWVVHPRVEFSGSGNVMGESEGQEETMGQE